jgi:hypothetical protein
MYPRGSGIYLVLSRIDSTLNSTVYAILRYGSTNGSNTSDPTSSDWTDVLGDECVDFDDAYLVPLVTKDAPSTVDQRVAFDSTFGAVVYDDVTYHRFLFNETTYSEYPHAVSGLSVIDPNFYPSQLHLPTYVGDCSQQREPEFDKRALR